MNERIKQIRKSLGLTQKEFGERLGVQGNTIAQYEINVRTPSDAVIRSICREFGVNEVWLREGLGDMFLARSRRQEIDAFMSDLLTVGDDDFRAQLVSVLAELSVDQWKLLEDMALSLAEKAKKKEE